MDDASIRALVGWRVQHGRLPRSEPLHLWAGHGHGAHCAGCGAVIEPAEVEYELEWAEPARMVRMHTRCYEIWHAERPAASKPPVSVSYDQVGTRPSWW
jgi:hypothetical protein